MLLTDTAPPPCKIGIDARFLRSATGGIGRYTRELLRALEHSTRHEVVVFITPADVAEWEAMQLPFRSVVVDAPHFSVAEQTKLLTALKAEKLDLVHFLNPSYPVRYRGPFVVTLHDLTLLKYPGRDGAQKRLKQFIYRLVLRRAITKARRVIAVSEYTALDAQREFGISPTQFEVVLEGGPEVYKLAFGSKAHVQEYLGRREPYILFLSQWRPHKGIGTILDAFQRFKEKTGAPHTLVLVGKQDGAASSVTRHIARLSHRHDVLTPGFAPDELLPALYAYATLFVMPSEYEGFGLPVLEALAQQTPCLIANASSLPEVGGLAAHYAPVRDVSAWAQQLERLLADDTLRTAPLTNASAQLARFSWKRMAQQTAAVYESALAR